MNSNLVYFCPKCKNKMRLWFQFPDESCLYVAKYECDMCGLSTESGYGRTSDDAGAEAQRLAKHLRLSYRDTEKKRPELYSDEELDSFVHWMHKRCNGRDCDCCPDRLEVGNETCKSEVAFDMWRHWKNCRGKRHGELVGVKLF